ncbi:MAG TPA: hypothetical protein VFU63_00925 [Ktedonobacterales bacterium]|nr:hypothetical protein [Ktedonobacterales bacterium]
MNDDISDVLMPRYGPRHDVDRRVAETPASDGEVAPGRGRVRLCPEGRVALAADVGSVHIFGAQAGKTFVWSKSWRVRCRTHGIACRTSAPGWHAPSQRAKR